MSSFFAHCSNVLYSTSNLDDEEDDEEEGDGEEDEEARFAPALISSIISATMPEAPEIGIFKWN